MRTQMIKSMYNTVYYRNKSIEQYGDFKHWYEILFIEIKENPLFDMEKFNQPNERLDRILNNIFNNKSAQTINVPKCPTCGSTHIKKISATSKVIGAATFGLFSKTAKSQFQCSNCGYKW